MTGVQTCALPIWITADVGARAASEAVGLAKLSIVGTGMLGQPGIAGTMFRTLAEAGINIEMISTSEIRITCIVARKQVEAGVQALHRAFRLDQEAPVEPAPV